MINLAVINIKDLAKIIIKILMVIIMIIAICQYIIFPKNKETSVSTLTEKIALIPKDTILSFLTATVPLMGHTESKKLLPRIQLSVSKLLDVELGMLESVIEDSKLNVKKEDLTIDDIDELIASGKQETEVQDTKVKTTSTNRYGKVQIKNETKFQLTDEILKPDFEIKNKKDILIFHTHTCESYTPTEENQYKASGKFRTKDLNYTVSKVGDELDKNLSSLNYHVIHDKTYHDYPAYSGSYDRSYKTVSNILKDNKDIDMVFDIHRDAIGSDSAYAPTVKIGNEYAAQIMIVIGTNGGGLEHPNWHNNLKIAVKIQEKAEEMYPGLFKPIVLRNARYNQNLANGASILEVGATGNTLEQCNTSMKYLAVVLNEILK